MMRLAGLLIGAGAVSVWVAGCGRPATPPADRVWQEDQGFRWTPLTVQGGAAGFRTHPADRSGLVFTNHLTEAQVTHNRHYLNGSGVALGDVDGDGLADVYLARLDGPNVLYRNLGGFRFEDITAQAGPLALPDAFSTGTTFADVEGDGDLDLLVAVLEGPNHLFLNDGTGRFTDVSAASGFQSPLGSMSLALADVEGDGDLDVYLANYKRRSAKDLFPPEVREMNRVLVADEQGGFEVAPEFREHYRAATLENGRVIRLEIAEPDVLYLNAGDGRFEAVSWSSGHFLEGTGTPISEAPRDWGLTALFNDLTGDGWPDLYVCNDFESPDRIWINQGDGRFRALSSEAIRNTSASTMSIAVSDVNRDGYTDFFLADMLSRDPIMRRRQVISMPPTVPDVGGIESRLQYMRNTLMLQREDGTFAEVTHYAGLEASEWTWASLFLDADLDGYEDLFLTNGHLHDVQDLDTEARIRQLAATATGSEDYRRIILLYPSLERTNLAFRNGGDGRFSLAEWGFGTDADVSHGMASADLDGDGDLDLVINRLGKEALVLENRTGAPRVAVRLKGRSGNTQGIGAVVRLYGGPVSVQTKEVTSGGVYLSGSEAQVVFAAGVEGAMRLEVVWPGGVGVSRVEGVKANRIYEVEQPATPQAWRVAQYLP